MAFRGKNQICSKIIINNESIEEVFLLKFLGCDEYDNDIDIKINRFQMICGTCLLYTSRCV